MNECENKAPLDDFIEVVHWRVEREMIRGRNKRAHSEKSRNDGHNTQLDCCLPGAHIRFYGRCDGNMVNVVRLYVHGMPINIQHFVERTKELELRICSQRTRTNVEQHFKPQNKILLSAFGVSQTHKQTELAFSIVGTRTHKVRREEPKPETKLCFIQMIQKVHQSPALIHSFEK